MRIHVPPVGVRTRNMVKSVYENGVIVIHGERIHIRPIIETEFIIINVIIREQIIGIKPIIIIHHPGPTPSHDTTIPMLLPSISIIIPIIRI